MRNTRIYSSRRPRLSIALLLAMCITLAIATAGRSPAANLPVVLTYPTNGATVAGLVTVNMTLSSSIWWTQLYIDGVPQVAGYNPLTWNSATVANGKHTLGVRAYLKNGVTPIGNSSILVTVANSSATPTPTPSATPTPVAYFSTLNYWATLPSDSQCAAEIVTTPETQPANAAFNAIEPTSAQLAAYAAGGYNDTYVNDYTQYERVDGKYTGSTDMIMRWAACKYGIDENVVRAQGWVESGWLQGAAGDPHSAESTCVNGSFDALYNTTIDEPDGSVVSYPGGCYQSWSIWQTKVYYEWMTWPEIMQSTAFAADYRFADTRACMDGAYTSYFASSAQQPNTYATDVANYKNIGGTTYTD